MASRRLPGMGASAADTADAPLARPNSGAGSLSPSGPQMEAPNEQMPMDPLSRPNGGMPGGPEAGPGSGPEAQNSETPRERDSNVTPRRPSTPTSMAGSSFTAPGGGGGLLPFSPMGGPDPSQMTAPGGGGMFGRVGGLQGGGLGVPQTGAGPAGNLDISELLQQLLSMRGMS